ncbi:hypothetical protein NUITMVA1_26800 [Aeromonas hydrophila]|nr:hypothetical protein NUITMVA1_26800 [Aeromonas hydrophila]
MYVAVYKVPELKRMKNYQRSYIQGPAQDRSLIEVRTTHISFYERGRLKNQLSSYIIAPIFSTKSPLKDLLSS